MGFRFRKSKNFGPFRVNVSKSGIGWSVGTKGLRYTKRTDGKTQTTYSIPGTGISYVDIKGKKQKISNKNNFNKKTKIPFHKMSVFHWLILIFLPPVGIFLIWRLMKYS